MKTRDIGRIVPIWKGLYDPGTTYELNDLVLTADSSLWWHVGRSETTGVAPEEGAVWTLVIDMSAFDASIREAVTEAIYRITAKGAEVLDSIPDDYTELWDDVVDLEDKAGKAVNRRDGSLIRLWAGTEEQYAAATKSADTIYLVGLLPEGGDGD